ncbi:Formaldehyde-activating enzyme [Serratia quinivorans]|uniref:formaldehyde-activating enzyme n=1 Tax=Serratia quinivorans TaxID=137545 RepID=UPI00217C26DF|nr:formaldehyde-activating enzyme [Serratia quinivorans]CAI0705616.1 Formaldehyde-activating enzyme [Serratia quinivorans]CAI0809457.1 Formaldehyde-activating enzyme [Serratia quinivorans]CAI0825873.1 Formaldehyde-activating enzyme [Serratia quinivorans]CAI1581818.1 Formaldehyde-activating enzyme [Serratia quinivorans]CAI1618284.1 Formaldehyde-activating enzyme [Serratia quinivorans]
MEMYIGEGFEGNGVNASHINIMIGPRDGVVGQAFSSSLASPSQGHCPFMVVVKPNVPTKPMTLYVNKAEISGELHGNATWGASQAAIAKAVAEALLEGILPPEAEDQWCIVTANWVNPACDNLDEVYGNNYRACRQAIHAAMNRLPNRSQLADALPQLANPFYTPHA